MLRRIAQALREQNWLAVAIEFVIVVAGVFLAFQITDWSTQASEARMGEAYQERLLGDLQIEHAAGRNVLEYGEQVERYALQAVTLYHAPPGEADADFIVAAYNATQFLGGLVVRDTYDELISTGRLPLLPAPEVGALATFNYLTDYRGLLSGYSETSPYRIRVRRLLPHPVQQAIREQCGDILDERGVATGLRDSCTLVLPDEAVADAARLLRADAEVLADLRLHISTLGYRTGAVRSRVATLGEGPAEITGESE
jgi:hypothetical protein